MSVGMLVGGIWLGAIGSKMVRNYFGEGETKKPDADILRKSGVNERIMANPHLLAQYNEKYVEQKLRKNSAMIMGSEKLQMSRSASLARTASSAGERQRHSTLVKKLSTPTTGPSEVSMGA